MNMISFLRLTLGVVLFCGSFFFANMTLAQSLETVVETYFDAATIEKGYTLESSDGLMRLGIRPDTLSVDTRVDIKTLDPSLMEDTYPSGLELIGDVYLFDIVNKESYDGSDFFFLEMVYPDDKLHEVTGRRQLYFFNGANSRWEVLPSSESFHADSIRSLIHLAYARLAIFEEPMYQTGTASWYGYKDCHCAASPDYPRGTYLVVNAIEDRSNAITVVVNDYGPDRSVHPERVIDLDKVAFEQLAPLWRGVIDVEVRFLQ